VRCTAIDYDAENPVSEVKKTIFFVEEIREKFKPPETPNF
jgi:hypothetical protein